MSELKQLKSSEIKSFRKSLLEKQNFKCAICGKALSENDAGISLDHQHRLNKNQEIGNKRIDRSKVCHDKRFYKTTSETSQLRSS